jgi:hypothetical protein
VRKAVVNSDTTAGNNTSSKSRAGGWRKWPFLPNGHFALEANITKYHANDRIFLSVSMTRAMCRRGVLLTPIYGKIEREDAFVVDRPSNHFRMAQGTDRVVVPGAPVVLHALTRERVILSLVPHSSWYGISGVRCCRSFDHTRFVAVRPPGCGEDRPATCDRRLSYGLCRRLLATRPLLLASMQVAPERQALRLSWRTGLTMRDVPLHRRERTQPEPAKANSGTSHPMDSTDRQAV